jgi:hypothetical protein
VSSLRPQAVASRLSAARHDNDKRSFLIQTPMRLSSRRNMFAPQGSVAPDGRWSLTVRGRVTQS